MSNAKRPTLDRKHTRLSETKRNAALDQGVRIEIDGEVYEVRGGDLTALDAGALRRQVGMTFPDILEAFERAPDLDLVAAVVWVARRLRGERDLAYEAVAGEMGYEVLDTIEVSETGAEEVEGDPEG